MGTNFSQAFRIFFNPEPIVINDIYDPLEFYRQVKRIYQNLPNNWTKKDIIADFTGMTAQGSVGMALASVS